MAASSMYRVLWLHDCGTEGKKPPELLDFVLKTWFIQLKFEQETIDN